jgi:mRNA-degrading endonuclease RelE of RelBE toxin-antitoxin system
VNIEVRKSFEKDSAKLPVQFQNQLSRIIEGIIMSKKLSEIPSCKKMIGYKSAYRIKMHNYRIGFFFENQIIELVRVLNRKDIYKYFP